MLIKASSHPIYLINNLDHIEQILVRDHKNFTKGTGYQRAKVILGNGILSSDGDFHDSQRKMISPAFHKSRVKAYSEIVDKCTKEMIDNWSVHLQDNNIFEMHKEMTKLFIAIICRSLFSIDADNEIIKAGELFSELFHGANPFLLLNPQAVLKLPIPYVKKFNKAKREFDELIKAIIKKRRNEFTEENLDILNMVMNAKDTDGSVMTDDALFDEVMTLIIAANDTSAKVMTWALYLLTQNEDKRLIAGEEVTKTLNGKFPGFDDYEKLPYIKMIINEAMRLYPPVWMILRTPINDFYLDDYFIRKDSSIFIVPYIFQRDSRYYENPDAFIPERWTDEERRKRPRMSYIPFGAGPRICVGETFSTYHMVVIMSAILQKFNLKLHPDQKIKLSSSITLKPKYGLRLILEKK